MRKTSCNFPVIKYDTAVCNFFYFRYLKCVKQYGFSFGSKLQNQPVDFRFCSDVNSLCRIIQKQDIRICVKPSCQKYLLLVATA